MGWWVAILTAILLVPAIGVPIAMDVLREPAFQSLDELAASDIRSIELFLLQRPDGGEDIGGTRGMFRVPEEHYDTVLGSLRNATSMEVAQPRGIWLGRMIVKLRDGRRQTVMFHRPRSDGGPSGVNRVEIRIGKKQFLGPDVNVFLKAVDVMIPKPPADEKATS
jgi:hypothetical protein